MSEPAPARPEDERGDETDDADDDEDHPCSLYVDPRHLSVDRPSQDCSDGDEEDAQADSHSVTPFASAESDARPVPPSIPGRYGTETRTRRLERPREREPFAMAVEFAHPSERALARVLDRHGIAWRYEPHTFVLERDENGTVREAFTPDFFLPDLGLYVECTVMRQALTSRKRRKARLTRERTGVFVEIMFRRDFERLARRWGLTELADAGRSDADVSAAQASGTRTAAVSESARMLESRESFYVDVEQNSGAAVVTAGGDVDLHSSPLLRDQLTALVDEGARAIVLDLSDATFLDSMALGVILAAKKRLTAEHGPLEVVVPRPEPRPIFEITMLDRVLDLHETQAGALGASGDAAV